VKVDNLGMITRMPIVAGMPTRISPRSSPVSRTLLPANRGRRNLACIERATADRNSRRGRDQGSSNSIGSIIMSKKVLITGATGDTGRAAVREALALDLDVRVMVRKIDERSNALAARGAKIVVGDLFDINSIRAALEGTESAHFVYLWAANELSWKLLLCSILR
jgi:FlaA1/EpsC-like NDP-sugar epimerase